MYTQAAEISNASGLSNTIHPPHHPEAAPARLQGPRFWKKAVLMPTPAHLPVIVSTLA